MMVFEELKTEGGEGGGGESSDGLSGIDATLNETYDGLREDSSDDAAFSTEGGEEAVPGAEPPPAATGAPPPTPTVRTAPKAWATEMHDHWGKLDPKVQEYVELREKQMLDGLGGYRDLAGAGKAFQESLAPFVPDIKELGIRPEAFVRNLANAHHILSKGTVEQKLRGFQKLANDYGIDLVDVITGAAGQSQQPPDPVVADLTGRLNKLEGAITEGQKAQYEALKASTDQEVSAFAADPAHPYFEEVADDIVLLMQDPRLDLKGAYEKAVWMNPLTRAKEQARMMEETRVKAAEEAKKAREARGTRVRGSDTDRSPSDPEGSMEDTLRATYKKIQSRTT